MNYYRHHIGDFDSGTRNMSRLERSFYRDMIEWYYAHEKPLPANFGRLCREVARPSANWRVTDMRGNAIPAELVGLLQRRAGFTQCARLVLNSLAVLLDEWLLDLSPLSENDDE